MGWVSAFCLDMGKCSSQNNLYFGEFYAEPYRLRPHLVGHSLFKATDKDIESVWMSTFLKYSLMILNSYLSIKIFWLFVGF